MRFMFDDLKAAQAAGYLLQRSGGSMPYIKLMKLLYLADRQSLVDTGAPVTGAYMVSMEYGPVLSEVLNLMTFGDHDSAWKQYVSAPYGDYMVSATRDGLPVDALSEYETDLLERLVERYRAMDRWKLVRLTHELPEWTDPGRSSLPIDPRRILEEAGLPADEIQGIAEQAEAVWAFRRVHAV